MFANPKIDPKVEAAWDDIVKQIAQHRERMASPIVVPEPPRGRYIRFAYNAGGYLAMPRQKGGRLRPHRNLKTLQRSQDFQRIAQHLFQGALQSEFKASLEAAKETSPYTLPQFTQEKANKLQKWAVRHANAMLMKEMSDDRRRARQRQDSSRRINAGLIFGSQNKAAHASA